MSIVVAFGRLLWLNYHYCRLFGWFSSAGKISSCCVWTNTGFACFALAVVIYFFYGQFLPKIISYKVRQAKRAQDESQNIVPILKNTFLWFKTNGSEIFTVSCGPLWFKIEPARRNFTYRIVYDAKNLTSFYNVANKTD